MSSNTKSDPPNYRDIERIEDSLTRLDEKVDKLGDQVSEMRTDTALLMAKFDQEVKQRHDDAKASSRRTKMWAGIIGAVLTTLLTIAGQLGWLSPTTADVLNQGVKQGLSQVQQQIDAPEPPADK